nr:phage terminase large subunit [Nocardioides soli]
MPPQEGKTTRVKAGVLWMMTRNKRRRVVAVSYGKDLAIEFGRDVRSWITTSTGVDGAANLGIRIARDNGSVSNWTLEGHRGGLRSVGIGGGITGRPADVMVIDDPIKNREEADSEVYRAKVQRYWTSTLSTRLAPGAPVIVILTRWHEEDLAGWLLKRPDGHRWRVVNIPAQADHDPNAGETDILGREPGEYMVSARIDERTGQPRTAKDWEQIKVQAGSADWESLYQGNPSPPSGNIVHRDWWKYYASPLWIVRDDGAHIVTEYDVMLMSWDMAFKDTDASDYVVGQVWMRRGARAYLLDQVRGRMSFVETRRRFKSFAAKWPQAIAKLVEDKANGTAVINSLEMTVGGIIPEDPGNKGKSARLQAVSPFIEAGNVWLPDPALLNPSTGEPWAPWVDGFVEEHAAFPSGSNDDQVDADSQALNRLLLQPLLTGETYDEDDLDDELADYAISHW